MDRQLEPPSSEEDERIAAGVHPFARYQSGHVALIEPAVPGDIGLPLLLPEAQPVAVLPQQVGQAIAGNPLKAEGRFHAATRTVWPSKPRSRI